MANISSIKLPTGTSYDLRDNSALHPSDVTSTYSPTGTAPVNGTAVAEALATLPEPMVFKGTLGTGGTVTTLPVDGSANIGDTYKVITDGTYASQAAKVGDVFICQNRTSSTNTWAYVPSGDETVSDTWRNIKVNGTEKLGSAISTGAVDFVNGTNTTVSFNSSGNKISISSTDTDRYVNSAAFAHDSTNDNVKMTLTRAGSDTATVTANIPKVSSSSAGVAPKGASVGTQTQSTKFLREDGTWAAPSYTTNAVTSVAGKTGDVTLTSSDVGLGNVGNFKAVSTVANQGLTDTEKSNARTNIGAGTGNGTITGITMNGASKGTSGVVDLGTVITEHQDISGKADKSATVSDVQYDTTNSKFKKTINGTTKDIATVTTTTVPNVTSVGSVTAGVAASLSKTDKTIPNVTSVGSMPTYTVTDETLTITAGATPTLGTDITATQINSWTTNTPTAVTKPTLGTAITVVNGFSTT